MKVLNKYLLLNEGAHGSGTQAKHWEAREGFPEEGAVPLLLLPKGACGPHVQGCTKYTKGRLLVGSRVPRGSGPCPLSATEPIPYALSSCRLPTQPVVESSCQENYIIDTLLGERTAVVQTISGSSQ